jgi:DNA polymerase I
MPRRVLDLYPEFRLAVNGVSTISGKKNLLAALTHYALDCMGADEKREMIELILSGGPWTAEQRLSILDYCQETRLR